MHRPNSGENLPVPNPGHGVPVPPGFAPPSANGYAPTPFVVGSPTAPPTAGVRALPTIAELIHAFKRRWVLALMVGGLMGTVLAVGVWMALPSGKHRVQATIRFRSHNPSPVGRQGGAVLTDTEFDRLMESHITDIQTKGFLGRVAGLAEVSRQPILAQADDKAAAVKGLLVIKRDPSEYLTLTMNGDEHEQLKTVLNAIVTEYTRDAEDKESRTRKTLLGQYKDLLAEVNKKIEAGREAMDKLRHDQGSIGESPLAIAMKDMFIQRTAESLKVYGDEVKNLELQKQLLAKKIEAGEFAPDGAAENDLIDKSEGVLLKKAAATRADDLYADGVKKLTPDNPLLKELKDAREKAHAAYEAEIQQVKSGSAGHLREKQKAAMQAKLSELTDLLALKKGLYDSTDRDYKQLQKERKDMVEGVVKGANDKADLDPLVARRNDLTRQKDELEILDRNAASRMEVVEGATIYPNYNLKQKIAFAVGAAVFGLLGVTLLLSYLEWRNRRIDGVAQVVTDLNMRVIGTIPAFPSRSALRSGEASANQNWRFILNESVNSTRTMLLHAAKTQQMQVLLVTSAMQGEGKTSLSSQLATSMATAGLRTLILDCDLRNPSMQKLFDIPVAPGCAEILLQEIDTSDAVQPTSVPNLWIIPAGQCNHRVIAALAQGHPLETLFQRLRGQFDIVVVDSCPILPVADTLLVAQFVDGVVFSILQDVSQLPKVQDASDRLAQLNIPLLGAVVNGIKPDVQAYGYNYVKQLPA